MTVPFGSLVHRITPNRSGVGRRLITFEYTVRQTWPEARSLFRDKTTPEQRAAIATLMPANKQFLVEV